MLDDISFLENHGLKYEYLNRKEIQDFLTIENGIVISLESKNIEEKALRIISNDKVALSYGSGDYSIAKMVENCISSLNYSNTMKKGFEHVTSNIYTNTFERSSRINSTEELNNSGRIISNNIYSLHKNKFDVIVYCWLNSTFLSIRNYRKLDVGFKDRSNYFFIRATEKQTNNSYGQAVYDEGNLELINNFNRFLELSLVKSNIMSGNSYTTVLHPRLMRNIILPIWKGFNKLTNKSDTSILDLCKSISTKITLYESPSDKRVNAFSPFDHEGSPTKELSIINKGYLNANINTNECINRKGSYFKKDHFTYKFKITMQPTLFPSSFRIEDGKVPVEELINSIKEGIFIVDSPSLWQNVDMNGNMKGTIGIGYKISNGKLEGSLKGINFSLNAYEVLGKNLIDISSNSELVCEHSDIMPYILTNGVNIL